MLTTGNIGNEPPVITDTADITIGSLLGVLAAHREKELVFFYGGRAIQAGYHVTEVKAGQFAALDCGANPEAWTEIFVQLWDVNEASSRMTAGKFSSIIRKVTEHVALDAGARLTFEISDGVQPIQLYRAALPAIAGAEVHVELSPRPASCKPRDRWLDQQKPAVQCCGSSADKQKPCCGN